MAATSAANELHGSPIPSATQEEPLSFQDILVHPDADDGRVLVVTLDRAPQRNAMSLALVESLLALLEMVETAEGTHAIVITGAGRGFCAGSDLAGLAGMTDDGRSAFEAASGLLAQRIGAHPLPILAAVHGFAIGGGLTLAAACDLVLTTADAKWSLPEVPIGLFPAWGLEPVLERVGRPFARRLSWGIDTLDGSAAATAGLADSVAEEPLAEAIALARRLADLPRSQSAAVKRYFCSADAQAAADREANDLFMAACTTPEGEATMRRFRKAP